MKKWLAVILFLSFLSLFTVSFVSAAESHIELIPADARTGEGTSVNYVSILYMSDGSSSDVTSQTTFSSSNTTVATISGNVATSHNAGFTEIRGRYVGAQTHSGLALLHVDKAYVANNPPVITSSPITQINENTTYSYQFTATDADGDALSYSLTQAPTWLSVSNTGLISGPAPLIDVDTNFYIILVVTDGVNSRTQRYVLTVKNIPGPFEIVINSTPVAQINENELYEYQVTAIGGFGAYTFSLSAAPDFLSINRDTGLVYGTATEVGEHAIVIKVFDEAGNFATQSYSLTVGTGNSIQITGCQEINSPGNYILQNDLNGESLNVCLDVHDTNGIYIDCENKGISFGGLNVGDTAVSIKNVSDFSLKNCVIETDGLYNGLDLFNSHNGVIIDNMFINASNGILVENGSNLLVKNNNFIKAGYTQISGSNNNKIEANTFYWDKEEVTQTLIYLSDGFGNNIKNNFVDGHGTGDVNSPVGSDNGIYYVREIGDIISDNLLQNFWNCGIENVGHIKDNIVRNNTIKNATFGGICGFHRNSMQNNTFSENKVDKSSTLFTFSREGALLEGESFVYFTDNTFTDNILTNTILGRGGATEINLLASGEIDSSKFIASNNIFRNNDFGTGPGPYIEPRSSIIDGGGNKCGPPNLFQDTSPLVCNAGGVLDAVVNAVADAIVAIVDAVAGLFEDEVSEFSAEPYSFVSEAPALLSEDGVSQISMAANPSVYFSVSDEEDIRLEFLRRRLTILREDRSINQLPQNLGNDLQYLNQPGKPNFVENSYIVEFNLEPTLPTYTAGLQADIPAGVVRDQVSSKRERVRELHERFEDDVDSFNGATGTSNIIRDISNFITGKVVDSDNVEIINKYENTFSGVSITASPDQAEQIKELNYIKNVYPNVLFFPVLIESVPLIGAPEVWQLDEDGNNCAESGKECLTGKNVTIAIIDTGVDYTHPDLGGCLGVNCKVVGGYDFIDNDDDPMDDHGHGTHVAATAAGKDLSGGMYNGVAPNANIAAYKVCTSAGRCPLSSIIAAIEHSADPNQDGDFSDRLDVISMSLGLDCKYYFGEYNEYCGPDDPISKAIDAASDGGVVAVIAAGNSGSSQQTINSPGTARKAITVGAIDKEGNLAYFSSRGPVIWKDENGIEQSIVKPDVVAPGVSICAAQWENAWESTKCTSNPDRIAISGTSMATPHVAGAVALLKQAHPDWTPEIVKDIIKKSSINLGSDTYAQGSGLTDVSGALRANSSLPDIEIDALGRISEIVGISGNLVATNFASYTVKVSGADGSQTSVLYTSTSLPTNRILVNNFDTRQFKDGAYFIIVTENLKDGTELYKRSLATIRNVELYSPATYSDIDSYQGDIPVGMIISSGLSYKLEYALADNPTQWSSNGIHATNPPFWDTRYIPDGKYLLKLTATYNNIQNEDVKPVTIKNVKIIVPVENQALSKSLFIIRGTVAPGISYSFDYASNDRPNEWHADGFTILNQQPNLTGLTSWNRNLLDGKVARWDTNLLDGKYVLRMKISYNNENRILLIPVEIDGTINPNFPQKMNEGFVLDYALAQWGGFTPILTDLDGDGKDEIIIKGATAQHVYRGDGTVMPGWPVEYSSQTITNGPQTGASSAGDLNKDGAKEIFVGLVQSCLRGYNIDGTVYGGFPCQTGLWASYFSSPAVFDLDGDGKEEIIITTSQPNSINVWKHDGAVFPGWPKSIGGDRIASSPAIGDIDKDGSAEIVYSGDGSLGVFNANGVQRSGFPVAIEYNFGASPILVDLNNDKYLEICVAESGDVVCFDRFGNIVTGWPFRDFPEPQAGWWYAVSFLAAGDIDSDGLPEIITGARNGNWLENSKLYVIDSEGMIKTGWPKDVDSVVMSQPVVGDIDGDGEQEIMVVTFKGSLYVFNPDGTLKIPIKRMPTYSQSGAAIGDIDGDGKSDVVAVDEVGNIYAWDFGGIYDDNNIQFKMYRNRETQLGLFSSTTNSICGNEIVETGEQCDDGNTNSEDGCSSQCVTEFCGDGIAQVGLGEFCDDGNDIDTDGCTSECQVLLIEPPRPPQPIATPPTVRIEYALRSLFGFKWTTATITCADDSGACKEDSHHYKTLGTAATQEEFEQKRAQCNDISGYINSVSFIKLGWGHVACAYAEDNAGNKGFATAHFVQEIEEEPAPVCGNNVIEAGEVCDGTDLNGQTCASQGYGDGDLRCLGNCLEFDTEFCNPSFGGDTGDSGDGFTEEERPNLE